jgi:hypothetical protein
MSAFCRALVVGPLAQLGWSKGTVVLDCEHALSGEKTELLALHHEVEGALYKPGTLNILAVGVDKYPGLSPGRAQVQIHVWAETRAEIDDFKKPE